MLTLDPYAPTSGTRSRAGHDAEPEPATTAGCAPHCARLCTEEGLATAYAAYAGALTGYCRRALADHGLAEEITQEVFVRAWRRCATFEARDAATGVLTPFAGLRTWLFAIARNAVIDAARGRGRRPAVHPDPERVTQEADPRDTYARFDTAEQVRGGLAGLSPDHRAILTAIFIDELTYGQAAARLSIPLGTVKSRVFYALRALRAQIDDQPATHGRRPHSPHLCRRAA
jgi:RNA polymerase sigma-70 factor (ECF subfamily)